MVIIPDILDFHPFNQKSSPCLFLGRQIGQQCFQNQKRISICNLINRCERVRFFLLFFHHRSRSMISIRKKPVTDEDKVEKILSNLLSNADYFDKETKKQLYLDIYDDSMWLINLIENMLSVTRLEEGRMNLNISVELVDDVIQEALRHVDRKKDEHTITVEHEDELLLARMDSRLIVQMVINLVDNAIKYTQKGSHIDIRTGREGKNAVISVADDGPGISDEMKEHIFETFYTGTNKIADSRRSLGLGLALCKSIVNVHGGEIKVSDAHPHGAVFQFTLPAGEVYLYEQTTDTGCGR